MLLNFRSIGSVPILPALIRVHNQSIHRGKAFKRFIRLSIFAPHEFFYPSPSANHLPKVLFLYALWRFWPFPLVDIILRTSVCTHNCISYSSTPNTVVPVLGVHINFEGYLVMPTFFFLFAIPSTVRTPPLMNRTANHRAKLLLSPVCGEEVLPGLLG